MQGKRTHFLFCIPLEATTLFLAYCQLVVLSLGVLYVILRVCKYMQILNCDNCLDWGIDPMMALFMAMGSITGLGVGLTLTILLVVGIKERKAGYVLAYVLCGMPAALGLFAFWLYAFSTEALDTPNFTILTIYLSYTVFLSMVYSTYCNIKMEKENGDSFYKRMQTDPYASADNRDNVFTVENSLRTDLDIAVEKSLKSELEFLSSADKSLKSELEFFSSAEKALKSDMDFFFKKNHQI